MMENILNPLFVADPELAQKVLALLRKQSTPIPDKCIHMLVEESFRGINQEIAFGYAIAMGFAQILGESQGVDIKVYRDIIRESAEKGPTFGFIMARYVPPVLIHGSEKLLQKFFRTVSIMNSKGTYTLKNALEVLSELLNAKEHVAAFSYLDLLMETFSKKITYNQSLHYSHLLPDTVRGMGPYTRSWILPILTRIIRADIRLAESFLEGFQKKLHLLSPKALCDFVETGLGKLSHSRQSASKFMALESGIGQEAFYSRQVTVSFEQIRHRLDRYLQARTGMPLSVKPLSEFTCQKILGGENTFRVVSDGRYIYLPETIGVYFSPDKNIGLYKCLTRLEASLYEFGTFDFDIEKLGSVEGDFHKPENCQGFDLTRFFVSFSSVTLAKDLFTVFEHGRIQFLMKQKYPGLVRQSAPFMEDEINRLSVQNNNSWPLFYLYQKIVLGMSNDIRIGFHKRTKLDQVADIFHEKISKWPDVETSASLVLKLYPAVESCCENREAPFTPPFHRKIYPELFFSRFQDIENLANRIRAKLQKQGIKVFKSDLRKYLVHRGGRLNLDDLKKMISLSDPGRVDRDTEKIKVNEDDLNQLFETWPVSDMLPSDGSGSVFWYREWNCLLNDYVHDYVRVLDRFMEEKKDGFYQQTLKRYQGLVSRIKYAFELLRPEQLKILKPWVEGDDFDYRALLDFVIDKKAGWLPSDQLYVKRLKQQRDVAVLLLVDLSKSTSNPVFQSTQTVLDVEKEAIILFAEALEVLGDKLAIAGFSGTGRLGVDYYRIKDFSESLNDSVKWRVNAMSPRRNTRMGAAIRHGLNELEKVEALVRLMILLGDGFPNDLEYKRDYAIEDTRKASSEAFARNISFKAITVNIEGDPRLDDLYGDTHHTVISEVRELPDKLLRIYSSLTKY